MSFIYPTAVVQKVNSLIEKGDYGRLFAVVHFASRQWKVTNEDLILIENHIDAECGDRIRMEKVCVTAIILCFLLVALAVCRGLLSPCSVNKGRNKKSK